MFFSTLCSLLEDPDTQIIMKTLGLMRNLLSGRDVSWPLYLNIPKTHEFFFNCSQIRLLPLFISISIILVCRTSIT